MLAEEFIVIDVESPLWETARPILNAVLRLEQQDEDSATWYGWQKPVLTAFLEGLPAHCTLLVGVWSGEQSIEGQEQVRETLLTGWVAEVVKGRVQSLRTFAALADTDLPPLEQLEPGYQDAMALMRATRKLIAPVAWALFTDKATWDEWIFSDQGLDKGEHLASLAQQGRCVLLGSQTAHRF
ncbi:hypothetical protein [Tengunoibacter tsumagoiensis]|uniref:Uncharacterized protein n=1 Tax=Tengunoibacter tsumagoiensis TaxID=2014871 RepID=A0A402A1U1_9CHLR|nr:hypothetical protein [Tengunoibacter tsumagoiensis]GCE13022.1 hypothetical protein KTT_28810 [Tengunoibacter tsumagoiensis]